MQENSGCKSCFEITECSLCSLDVCEQLVQPLRFGGGDVEVQILCFSVSV